MKKKTVKRVRNLKKRKVPKVSLKSIYGGPEEGEVSKVIIEDEDEI